MAQSKENTNVSARGKSAAANQNAGAPAAQTGEKRPRTTRRPYYNRRPRRPQQPREAAVPIHIYPLGGLGEVGKNMTVYARAIGVNFDLFHLFLPELEFLDTSI